MEVTLPWITVAWGRRGRSRSIFRSSISRATYEAVSSRSDSKCSCSGPGVEDSQLRRGAYQLTKATSEQRIARQRLHEVVHRRAVRDSVEDTLAHRGEASQSCRAPCRLYEKKVKTQRLLITAALLFGLAFFATYLVALHTAQGLHDDAALYARVAGNGLAPVQAAGRQALATIDVGSLAVAALVLCFLALARGRVGRAIAAAALIAMSVGSVELLKHGLPHVGGAIPSGRPATFPSGHTSVAVSLGLALVLAAPPVLRPIAALVGAAYAAGIALSVVALGWHYPSDAVASFFICGFWACIAGIVSGGVARRPRVSVPGLLAAVVIVAMGLFAAAILASRHPYAVAAVRSRQSLIATAAVLGALSLATFGALMPLFEEEVS